MCLYSVLDAPCSHAQCSIVGSIVNANRDVIRQYGEPFAADSPSEMHKVESVEVAERQSTPEPIVQEQVVEIQPEPESEKQPTLEYLAGAIQDMRHQIDGVKETQRLILSLLQQAAAPNYPK